MTGQPGAVFAGWGTFAPERRVTNHDWEQTLDTTDEWIVDRTGIKERRWAAPEDTTSSMAVAAGAAAIKDAGLTPDDIDLLILATTTPDQIVPAASAFVSDGLGLRCGAFDLNAACAGFAYSLVVATSILSTGAARNILVIGAETISRFINPEDRGTAILFGDGAGATVVQAGASGAGAPGLLAWDLGCDGSAAQFLEVRGGGSRLPASAETLADGDHFVRMDGNEIFRRAVRAVVGSATATLDKAGVTADEVNLFVPHQANVRIIDAICSRLDIPAERTVVNIERYGNTSAASIPLALVEAHEAGRINDGDLVLLSGFGAGMTWASALIRWGRS
ncbi:MAG: beta-ketoacyl-ACP synthase III [Acidimicrobiales bacterium]